MRLAVPTTNEHREKEQNDMIGLHRLSSPPKTEEKRNTIGWKAGLQHQVLMADLCVLRACSV